MSTKALTLLILIAVLGVVLTITFRTAPYAQDLKDPEGTVTNSRLIPGEIIIFLKRLANEEDLDRIVTSYGGTTVYTKDTPEGLREKILKFPGANLEMLEQISREIANTVQGVSSVSPHWVPGPIY